ncbi:hypothetical protein [Limosilactobacillus coleohominis]|uniref:hypothetical protein n=1 Tax=Limosilactobacillus coleohominis TaxID=181675 RepID=UPI0026F1D09D|nr:hypothetical protein [Limosilactobacillus coleohominis]
MRSTKQYGLVNSWQEHQALIKAEHTYEKLHKNKKKPAYSKDVSAIGFHKKRRCGEMT